jgi:cytochrome c55X
VRVRRIGAAALLVALAAPAFAQDTAASAPDAAALANQGRRVCMSLCARCHGLNLVSSGIGFDLRQFPKDNPERFRDSVSKCLRAMPAWEGVLKPRDLEALWAYIGSVNRWQ